MTMTTTEMVKYLLERAVEQTPGVIPDDIMALLSGIFDGLLADDTLPERYPCLCTACMIGAAGDRLYEITGDSTWGSGWSPQ